MRHIEQGAATLPGTMEDVGEVVAELRATLTDLRVTAAGARQFMDSSGPSLAEAAERIRREGENPVPHYWAHVFWAFGARDMDDFLARAAYMTLEGHLDRVRVPFLVTHGAQDRQISVDYAHRTYGQLVNSPRRELKIFTAREGGVEHVGADNMSFGCDYIADWFAETLGGHTA